MNEWKKLGEIFVEQNILCRKSVERVAAIAKRTDKRFGALLEEIGLITGEELAVALAQQHKCKTVFNFAKASFNPHLLNIITADTALQNLIFPLQLEKNKLCMAVYDPTNVKILNNIAANNNLSIIPVVSSRTEITTAICNHYLGINVTESTRKTILIVEDNNTALSMLRDILSPYYHVITATDGMEAFKAVISKKPHVILTDKEMPKLDGFGLLSALRDIPETKIIPVILISGIATAKEESQAFKTGFFDFIRKPITETTIITRVKRAFDFYEKNNYLFVK